MKAAGTKDQTVPRQHSNPADRISNKTGKQEEIEKDGTVAPTEDPDEMNEFETWTKLMHTIKDVTVDEVQETFGDRPGDRFVKMTVVEHNESDAEDVDVRAHTDFRDVIARLVKGSNLNISASDNGADTCVVGTGWKVLIKTAQWANLVGFDSNHARKKGLPIVTADTGVRLQDGTEAVIRAHEAVCNEGSPTALISEFQVRTHGLVLDSVHKEHAARRTTRLSPW